VRLVFPMRGDNDKGQHSLRPFERRLRVRPLSVLVAPAGAAKSLQKFSFWRQSTDSPELLVRQAEKERIRNGAPGWLTDDAGALEDQTKQSQPTGMLCDALLGWRRMK